jgi:protocadherin delta 1
MSIVSYKFTVAAIDEDLPILRSEVPVIVEVMDVNDHSPVFEFPTDDNRTFSISNAVPMGYAVVRVVARDRDTGNNSRLVYRISGARNNKDEKEPFQIDRCAFMRRQTI